MIRLGQKAEGYGCRNESYYAYIADSVLAWKGGKLGWLNRCTFWELLINIIEICNPLMILQLNKIHKYLKINKINWDFNEEKG